MFACGFLAAGAILVLRLRELGQPTDYAYEMACGRYPVAPVPCP